MIKLALTLTSIALGVFQVGQNVAPPDWTLEVPSKEIKAGDEFTINITTDNIAKDWYIYASDFELEYGPIAASIELAESEDFTPIGNLISVDAKAHYDDVFEGDVVIFEDGKAKFTQRFKANKDNPVVKGTLTYQMCSQVTGMCVLFNYEFNTATVK